MNAEHRKRIALNRYLGIDGIRIRRIAPDNCKACGHDNNPYSGQWTLTTSVGRSNYILKFDTFGQACRQAAETAKLLRKQSRNF